MLGSIWATLGCAPFGQLLQNYSRRPAGAATKSCLTQLRTHHIVKKHCYYTKMVGSGMTSRAKCLLPVLLTLTCH